MKTIKEVLKFLETGVDFELFEGTELEDDWEDTMLREHIVKKLKTMKTYKLYCQAKADAYQQTIDYINETLK